MVPPAPPRFSTTNCWPRSALSLLKRIRAVVSAPPAGGYGTTTRTGRSGQAVCAAARPIHGALAMPASTVRLVTWVRAIVLFPSVFEDKLASKTAETEQFRGVRRVLHSVDAASRAGC